MRYLARCLVGPVLTLISTTPVLSQTSLPRASVRPWLPVYGRDGDLLIVPATVDGKPVRAMVDSGVVGVMLNKAFADREGMPLTQIDMAQDLGGRQARYTTPHFQLSIDGIEGPDAPVQVSDLTRLEQASGSQIDVVIGTSFIAAYGLEIDFDNRRLRFGAPEGAGSSQLDVPLHYDGKEFTVSASANGGIVAPLYLDLGSNGGVRLTGADASGVIGARPVTDVEFVGAGGREITGLATLSNFIVGGIDFGAVETQLAPGGDSDRPTMAGSLGLDVLGRYNLSIDVRRSVLTLKPRTNPVAGPPKSTIGLQVRHEPNRIIITHVMKNSPAIKAGFREGDAICSINGEIVDKEWNSKNISKWGTSNSGSSYKVVLCSGKYIMIRSKEFY